MSHFAKVNQDGVVINVIKAEQDVIDSGILGTGWIQTSYNTRGGVHYGPDHKPDGGVALRMNFACINGRYDAARDAFVGVQPYASWVFDETTCLWNPPVPYPHSPGVENEGTKLYNWDEAQLNWVEVIHTE